MLGGDKSAKTPSYASEWNQLQHDINEALIKDDHPSAFHELLRRAKAYAKRVKRDHMTGNEEALRHKVAMA